FAWISWDHPHMPWVSTRLNSARINADSKLSDRQVLAGSSSSEAIQQPRFISDNSLVALSDKTGWWNLYRYLFEGAECTTSGESGGLKSCSGSGSGTGELSEQSVRTEPLWPRENDFGIPQWQLGVYTWDELTKAQKSGGQSAEKRWVACYMERGEGRLVIGSASMQEQLVAEEYSLFRHVCSFNEKVYCIAASNDHAAAIIEITPDSPSHEAIQVIAGGQLPAIKVDLPQPITYPVGDESAYGFLYLPQPLAQSESEGPGSKPPLIVFTHGGPTGATYPVYNPKIQFWVSRGFAVVDLNYRGSTGYGRDYRLRLAGSWGETDWQDAVAAVDYLAKRELIDPDNVFIRGGSAGGYTTLCALVYSEHFKGGASYYGVSDPVALTRDTHKFESHYLDWLIGDPEQDAELYLQRSPLEHADQVNCPMIFFQGGKDRVVVPQQTEVMVNALKRQNIPVEYHLYPDEQHGFRQAENQIHSLEAELAFYRGLLT
ncbi:MAG: S9 family peptidase, partial [Amphritea sp.]|nr:S9 family peptidase [Amphritea sp.]